MEILLHFRINTHLQPVAAPLPRFIGGPIRESRLTLNIVGKAQTVKVALAKVPFQIRTCIGGAEGCGGRRGQTVIEARIIPAPKGGLTPIK